MTLKPKQLIAGILAGTFIAWALWLLQFDLLLWLLIVALATLLLGLVVNGPVRPTVKPKERERTNWSES